MPLQINYKTFDEHLPTQFDTNKTIKRISDELLNILIKKIS